MWSESPSRLRLSLSASCCAALSISLPTPTFTMQAWFSVACIVLKSTVTAVAILNELALFTSQWVISPSHPPTLFPHPLYTSAAYAIAEPLYTILITQIAVQAWINLLNTVQHIWLCQISMDYIVHVLNRATASPTQTPKPSDLHEPDKKGNQMASEAPPDQHEPRSKWETYVAVLFPVHSAAACNAALLLFAADLGPSLKNDNANVTLFFSSLATLFYLGSRYADFKISDRTYKVSLWKPQSQKNLTLQLGCLVL